MDMPVFVELAIQKARNTVTKLNERAGMEGWIISLAIGILVLAYILPLAFDAFYSADVTHFCKSSLDAAGNVVYSSDTTVQALWYLVPVLIIIGIIVYFAKQKD